MAIVKKSNFTTTQNLTNMGYNVELNSLTDGKSIITVNFGTSPATVNIQVGSKYESNGNEYVNEGTIKTFQMSNATHNYIITDGENFDSASTIGTWNSEKLGYYQNSIFRTLGWYIDQTGGTYQRLIDVFEPSNLPIMTERYEHMLIGMSGDYSAAGVIPFDTVIHDQLSSWDAVTNYRFTVVTQGYYDIKGLIFQSGLNVVSIRKNGITIHASSTAGATIGAVHYLVPGDYVDSISSGAGTVFASASYMVIDRLF